MKYSKILLKLLKIMQNFKNWPRAGEHYLELVKPKSLFLVLLCLVQMVKQQQLSSPYLQATF